MGPADRGIALSRAYFDEVVAPVLQRDLSDVEYAAARVGQGSEVLGLDDAMSRDHDWGLRLQLFVAPAERARVLRALDQALPADFRGHPLRFGTSAEPAARLQVEVTSVSAFAEGRLGFDPRAGTRIADWLSLTGQSVLEVVSGAVFADPRGDLGDLRAALDWYPDEIWRYLVACDWQRLDQELPLMGRAGHLGDSLGSRIIAARLSDVAVHLGFLLCRAWAPYSKWRGTVFRRLPGCATIGDDLGRVLDARDWRDRQAAFGDALDGLAALHQAAGFPEPPSPVVVDFWDRPYVHVDPRLIMALSDTLAGSDVGDRSLGVGSVEQQTDNVDVLTRPDLRRAMADLTPGSPA